jgi:trigger factor
MVLGRVLDKTVQETAANAMKEKEIRPALQPKITLKDETSFDENKDLTYTMTVEILPSFEVADLSGFRLRNGCQGGRQDRSGNAGADC